MMRWSNPRRSSLRMLRLGLCLLLPLAVAPAIAGTDIDVLVVYTSRVATWAAQQQIGCDRLPADAIAANLRVRTLTGLEHPCTTNPGLANNPSDRTGNLVQIAIAETNQIYTNSGLSDVHFHLAAALRIPDGIDASGRPVVFDESFTDSSLHHEEPLAKNIAASTGIGRLLYALRNRQDSGDGNTDLLNAVHQLRRDYNADLVLMLVDRDAAEPTNPSIPGIDIGGLAMAIGISDPRNAFAVLDVQNAIAPSYVFAHELSHLLAANHYDFRSPPLIGPLDLISELPDLVNGRIDNQAFQKTVTVNADGTTQPAPLAYSTLMGGFQDAAGGPVIPARANNANVATNAAWNGTADSDGNCVTSERPTDSAQVYTIVNTVLPVLSTLNPQLPKPLPVGAPTGGTDISACVVIQLTLADGTTLAPQAKKLLDVNSRPRNNARMVGKFARLIAQFQLDSIVDAPQDGSAVGIDFGPSTALGWDILPPTRYLRISYPTLTCETGIGCPVHTGIGSQRISGRYWNNVTSTAAGTTAALLSEDGQPANATLTITRRFYGTGSLPPSLGASLAAGRDEAPTMALTDYFTAIRLYTPPELTISGLTGQSYTFRVFGTEAAADSYRVANFDLISDNGSGGSITARKSLGTQGNIAHFVEFRHVKPLNGTITLRVVPDLTVPFFTAVGLSAVTYFSE